MWRVNLFSNQFYYTPYYFVYLCLHTPKHVSSCHTLPRIALCTFRALPTGPFMSSLRHISVSPSMFLKFSFHIFSHMYGNWICSIPITIPPSFISGFVNPYNNILFHYREFSRTSCRSEFSSARREAASRYWSFAGAFQQNRPGMEGCKLWEVCNDRGEFC